MDPRFNAMFEDPENQVFKVVFYPDRIYHAAYLNATRSRRYRYNVQEVRNAFDITVMKAEVYLDGIFLSNLLRIEYRAARLTEVAREKSRFLRNRVLTRIKLCDPTASTHDDLCSGPEATIALHFDRWINAFQAEIWEINSAPPRTHHDFKVLDQIGHMGPITSVSEFKNILHNLSNLSRLEVSFRENVVDLPFGYQINDPQWDNNYMRNHQVANTNEPSSNANTVSDDCYLIDFQRGHFFTNIDQVTPVRYRNGMMTPDNPEAKDTNIIEMRWVLQREFASSVVFFHKVTIPPGAIEGTHRHIGTEELYCIVEGEGIAYMADGDDPANNRYPLVERQIYGLGTRVCRELPVKPGSVIFTKSGGIHGIRNPSSDQPLRFVAFLYHTS
jgi:mannose-6-phosphate isomerase-like protein (cupin superfamily)